MYLKNLTIKNVGPIQEKSFQFQSDINIITGNNGSGKTTILSSIYSCLVDDNAIQFNKSVDSFSRVSIKIDDIIIEKYYSKNTSYYKMKNTDLMKKIVEKNFEKHVLYLNSSLIHNKCFSKQDIKEINEFLKENNQNLYNYFKNSSYYMGNPYLLYSNMFFYNIFKFVLKCENNSIVLIDLSAFDHSIFNEFLKVLECISNVQFIISINTIPTNIDTDINILSLEYNENNQLHAISVNYNFIPKIIFSTNEETVEIYRYNMESKIELEEGFDVEFKEVKSLSIKSIIDNAEIYINAYLNSLTQGYGSIIWGVSDKRIIKGVYLSYENKDEIRRTIAERMSKFNPSVKTQSYEISFENVYKDNKIVEDYYLIIIKVYTTPSLYYYSTSKDDVYIKTDAGKTKLNVLRIQEKLLARIK